MKERYRLSLRRKSVYDAFDHTPKTFQRLKTKDEAEAERLLVALNEAGKQPAMNLSLPGFKGVLNFVVTLTTHKDVRSYPCRSMESAIKLVERFIAGVTKPARPSTPEAETNPHQYDGPPRTAEQVAA